MKTLLLMRHAKASREDPSLADHDRPLTARGKRDAPRMGRLLRKEGQTPDLIVSSPAKRALATAKAVAKASHCAGDPIVAEYLYPGDPPAYVRALHALTGKCDRVLVVGHNPGLESFLGELARVSDILPTGAVAVVELPIARWREFRPGTRGRLINVWRPWEVVE